MGNCLLIRNATISIKILPFPTTKGYPSSQANAQSTWRQWTDYTYVLGIAENNYWNSEGITWNDPGESSPIFYSSVNSSGYHPGLAYPTDIFKQSRTYFFLFNGSQTSIREYKSTGELLHGYDTYINGYTPDSSARWTIILLRGNAWKSKTLAYIEV